MNEDITKELIYKEIIDDLDRDRIINCANKNGENPFGYVIDYIKDMYGCPKVYAWDIAKRVCEHFFELGLKAQKEE